MSVSYSVVGIVPADAAYKKKLAAYRACEDAGVDPPEDLRKFFNDDEPDPSGVVRELAASYSLKPMYAEGVTEYTADMENGFEVDLRKLPPEIKIIRFVNSY